MTTRAATWGPLSPVEARPEFYLRTGHSGWIDHLAWGGDGKSIVTEGDDGRIIVWDASGGRPERTVLPGSGTMVWSPNGALFARVAGYRRRKFVQLWSPFTGEAVARLDGSYFYNVGWSPDSRIVAVPSDEGTTTLWHPFAERHPVTIEAQGAYAWSPDSRVLATSGRHRVQLWDAHSGERLSALHKLRGDVREMAWSPDGRHLAVGGMGEQLFVWDLKCDNPPLRLSGHDRGVSRLAWSPDGATLAAGTSDDTVLLWRMPKGRRLGVLNHAEIAGFLPWWSIQFLSGSPDGRYLVSGSDNGSAVLWDARSAKAVRRLTNPESLAHGTDEAGSPAVAWTPDSELFALYAPRHDSAIYSATTGQVQARLGKTTWLLAWDPKGETLAGHTPESEVTLWDREGGIVRALGGRLDQLSRPTFSPTGEHVALSVGGGAVLILNARTGLVGARLRGHTDDVSAMAWSPDAHSLATGSRDKTIIIWDVATGKKTTRIRKHKTGVSSLAWSPNGDLLASGSRHPEGHLLLWDVNRKKALKRMRVSTSNQEITGLKWDRSGVVIAATTYGLPSGVVLYDTDAKAVHRFETRLHSLHSSSPDLTQWANHQDGALTILDPRDGTTRTISTGLEGYVPELDWSSDGRWLAIRREQAVHLLEVASEEVSPPLQSADGRILSVHWSPHSQSLAMVTLGATSIWDAASRRITAVLPDVELYRNSFSWSPDGHTLSLTPGAGGLRGVLQLWDAGRGKLRADFYSFNGGTDWITVTPGGYFVGSPGAVDLVSWRVRDRLVPVETFQSQFEKPRLVERALTE